MNKGQDRDFGSRRQELLDVLPNIRRFAMSLAGALADADDLLQSTVERLLTRGLPDDAPVRRPTTRTASATTAPDSTTTVIASSTTAAARPA